MIISRDLLLYLPIDFPFCTRSLLLSKCISKHDHRTIVFLPRVSFCQVSDASKIVRQALRFDRRMCNGCRIFALMNVLVHCNVFKNILG
jgi:hypothetical protein